MAPDAIFAFFVCGAIYCLVRGYQHQHFRRAWFAGFWFCASLATLTKGLGAILYLAVISGLLALFLREARLRFRLLLHWTNLLLFVAIVAPWLIWVYREFSWSVVWTNSSTAFPRWHLLLLHLAWWFPAVFLVLPAFIFRSRRILPPDEVTLAERLPVCWLFVSVVVEWLLAEGPSAAIATAPAFALLAATAWQRTSRPLRALGIISALIVGLCVAAIACFQPGLIASMFGGVLDEGSRSLRPLSLITIGSLFVSALAALLLLRQRGEITLVLALATMVPIGWCLIEARARLAPSFSLADAARYLNPRLGPGGQVIYEGSIESGNSLAFYLEKKFFFVNQSPRFLEKDTASQNKYLDEHFLLEAWERSDPLYLIIEGDRVAYWRRLIIDRVHIYHQVGTCGSRVVLSNQL